jgi:hypothetical protein
VSLRRRGFGFRGGFNNYLQDTALGRIKILVLAYDHSEVVTLLGLHRNIKSDFGFGINLSLSLQLLFIGQAFLR